MIQSQPFIPTQDFLNVASRMLHQPSNNLIYEWCFEKNTVVLVVVVFNFPLFLSLVEVLLVVLTLKYFGIKKNIFTGTCEKSEKTIF